jgi:hypothetical protein
MQQGTHLHLLPTPSPSPYPPFPYPRPFHHFRPFPFAREPVQPFLLLQPNNPLFMPFLPTVETRQW